MYSSKPNVVIRFYTQSKASWKSANPQSVAKILLTDSEYTNVYPDFIVQHRKFIIEDYKKKTEQIKNLKQRFPYTQRTLAINQNKSSISQRSSLSPKRVQRRFNKTKTQLQSSQRQESISKSCVNTINLQYFVDKPPLLSKMEKYSKGVSQFQKNAIKRMKTREDMILKKKCDSLLNQTQKNSRSIQKRLCINSAKAKERKQQQIIFS